MRKPKLTFVILIFCLVFTSCRKSYKEPLADSVVTFQLDLLHNKKIQEYNGELPLKIIPRKKLILRRETSLGPSCSVCDVQTGKEICSIRRDNLRILQVSNDEQRCVILYCSAASNTEQDECNLDYRIGLFDLETGEEINNWPSIHLDLGNTTEFQGYFSSNSKYFLILVGTISMPKALVIESDSGKIMQEYQLGYFRPVAISKDHRFVALATPKGYAFYLSLDLNQTEIFPYYPIVMSHDGNYILSADEDNEKTVYIFLNAKTGKVTQKFYDLETGMCDHISIAPDCKTIWNNSTLWSTTSGKVITHVNQRSSAFYSSNGEFVYLFNQGLLLDSVTGNLIWNLGKREAAVTFSDKSESLLLRNGTIMSTSHDGVVSRIAGMLWSNEEKNRKGVLCSVAGHLKYIDLRSGKVLLSMEEKSFLSSGSYKAHSFIMPENPQQIFVTYRKSEAIQHVLQKENEENSQ